MSSEWSAEIINMFLVHDTIEAGSNYITNNVEEKEVNVKDKSFTYKYGAKLNICGIRGKGGLLL